MIYIKDGIRFPEKKLQRMQISDPQSSGYEVLNVGKKPTTSIHEKVVDNGNVNVDGDWFIDWKVIDKSESELSASLDTMKVVKAGKLSEYFSEISKRPIIDTGYGFSVQAGYSDLLDFQVGLKRGLLTIRAADNSNHTVTQEQFEDIIDQIENNGIRLKSIKWALQDEIKNASIEELEEINFEEQFNA